MPIAKDETWIITDPDIMREVLTATMVSLGALLDSFAQQCPCEQWAQQWRHEARTVSGEKVRMPSMSMEEQWETFIRFSQREHDLRELRQWCHCPRSLRCPAGAVTGGLSRETQQGTWDAEPKK